MSRSASDLAPAPARPGDAWLWLAWAVAFAPALAAMAGRWASTEYLQHGFLVPLVSAAVARRRARGLPPAGRWGPGLAGLGAALALYVLGLALDEVALQGLAWVGSLSALVAFRWGPEGWRRLRFPLLFLLFMVPPPASWVAPLILALQQLASSVAIAVLHTLGLAVLREGNVMHLPGGETLFVDEACSGITSLVSLVPIGVLIAWLGLREPWRRGLVVAAVVPAALLGNALRVVATVVLARRWGVASATSGGLHELAGLLASAFAVGVVLAVCAGLRRGSSR